MASKRVIVIGGGAAGLMAAGQAAAGGAETLVLEKMDRPGRKLLITGKGRCNLTNIASLPEFIQHFGPQGKFLRQAFARFFSEDLVAFLEEIGVATMTERGGRVFPASEAARDVVACLVDWAMKQGATIRARTRVTQLTLAGGCVTGVRTADGGMFAADAVVLATGGASYPGTGSSGDGYRLAEQAGHAIVASNLDRVPRLPQGAWRVTELRTLVQKMLPDTDANDARLVVCRNEKSASPCPR